MKVKTWSVESRVRLCRPGDGPGTGGHDYNPSWSYNRLGYVDCQGLSPCCSAAAVSRVKALYREGRQNGAEIDMPARPLPGDGQITWPKGSMGADGFVTAFSRSDGRYEHEVKYVEGTGDKAWMEERDRNYVFRLLREGIVAGRDILLEREPNLATEVPALYLEIVEARRILAAEATFMENPLTMCLRTLDRVDKIDLAETTRQYQAIRASSSHPNKAEIIKRLPPLPPPLDPRHIIERLPELFTALQRNISVKTLILANFNLSTVVEPLAVMLAARPDITHLDLTNTNLTDMMLQRLLEVLQRNQVITQCVVTGNPAASETQGRLDALLLLNRHEATLNLQTLNVTSEAGITHVLNLLLTRDVTHLNLQERALTLEHVRLLCQFIARSQQLKSLDLSGIRFTEEMGSTLLAAVKENHSLTSLNITGTGLRTSFFMRLRIHMRHTDPSAEVIQEDRSNSSSQFFPSPLPPTSNPSSSSVDAEMEEICQMRL